MNDATRALVTPIILSQDRDLVGEFLNRYRDSSFRIAMRILGNQDAAEDVAQEAIIRAFRSWDTLSGVENQAAWVRKVVVRCALNAVERTPNHTELSDVGNEPDESVLVQAVLESLAPEHRAVLGLAVGEGLSYREIADALEIPIGTVGSRLNSAKAAFKRAWEGSR